MSKKSTGMVKKNINIEYMRKYELDYTSLSLHTLIRLSSIAEQSVHSVDFKIIILENLVQSVQVLTFSCIHISVFLETTKSSRNVSLPFF